MTQISKEALVKEFAESSLLLTAHGFERIIADGLDAKIIISTAKERKQWLVSNEFLMEFVEDRGDLHVTEQPPLNERTPIQAIEPVQVIEPVSTAVALESGQTSSLTLLEPKLEEARRFLPAGTVRKVVVEVARPSMNIYAKEIESGLQILKDSDVTEKSTCEGKLEDFVEYFNQKYICMRDILRDRENFLGAVPIEVLKKYKGEVSYIVAMVKEKRESKKGYLFLDVEDPTGEVSVLIPKDNDALRSRYAHILPDEVIGIQGKLMNDLMIAADIVEPELPINHRVNYADVPAHAALLSDIHVGSNLFLEKEFNKFLDWLNLRDGNEELAGKIKYVLVAGDLVDGIGIYPGQDKELIIPDIYKQYDFLAMLLEKVPDYIEVVLAVGNHDACRGAEPQPKLSKEMGGKLYDLPNVHLVGNPISLCLNGVKTLMYHGTTMDTIIGNITGCSYSRPETAMIEYLKKRHLAPMYGNDSLSPEKRDYMAIKEIPDIFHAGHVHTNGYATYRGVKIINSGTWQARTKYQETLGHVPTPARVPIINLQNHEVTVMHFGE
jgi:DNA polymerase II small subunit